MRPLIDQEAPQKPRGPKFFMHEADFIAAHKKYTSKYPKLKDIFILLEHAFDTYRNDFYRLEDLTIGFLHAVNQSLSTSTPSRTIGQNRQATRENAYTHWRQVSGNPQNMWLLLSSRIPQDFYDEITEIARQILNEIPDIPGQEPEDKFFFGGAYGHPLGYDVLMNINHIVIPIKHVSYIAEKIIHELIAQKTWSNLAGLSVLRKTELWGTLYVEADSILLEALSMWLGLFESPTLPDVLDMAPHENIHLDLSLLKKGIEEFVQLELALAAEDYRCIIDTLGSSTEKHIVEEIHPKTKKKNKIRTSRTIIGRLDDPEYTIFSGHYQLLGIQFFAEHTLPLHTWSKKYKDYLCLLNLLHLKKGLKKSEIMNEADIKKSLAEPPKEDIEKSQAIRRRLGALLRIPQEKI
jgi:hypothetical protein